MKKMFMEALSMCLTTILAVATVGSSSIQVNASESNEVVNELFVGEEPVATVEDISEDVESTNGLKFINRWNESEKSGNVLTFNSDTTEYVYDLGESYNAADVYALVVNVSNQQGAFEVIFYDYDGENYIKEAPVQKCESSNYYSIRPGVGGKFNRIGFKGAALKYPFRVTIDNIYTLASFDPSYEPYYGPTNDPTEEPASAEPTTLPTTEPASAEPTTLPTEVPASSEPTATPETSEVENTTAPTVEPTSSPAVVDPAKEQQIPGQTKEETKPTDNTEQTTTVITKKDNTLKVSGKTVKVARGKKKTLKVSKVLKVTKAIGKVTYQKVSGNKKITINKKTGKVTVKKGLKKGTYKIKVKVKAAGNNDFNATEKTVTFKVKVK